MDYTQINIKELSERAMINRKTFYLHYNSLDELLGKMQLELYTDIIQSVSGINEKILLSQGNFPIGKSPGDYARKKMFHYHYLDNNSLNLNKYQTNIFDAYLSGSFISIYTQWVTDGRKVPLEIVIQISTKLISKGLCAFGMSDGTVC